MGADPKHIIAEAMQLEPNTRAFIAEALLASLDFEEDFAISAAWLAEIQQRCTAIDNGTARMIDQASALAHLRSSLV